MFSGVVIRDLWKVKCFFKLFSIHLWNRSLARLWVEWRYLCVEGWCRSEKRSLVVATVSKAKDISRRRTMMVNVLLLPSVRHTICAFITGRGSGTFSTWLPIFSSFIICSCQWYLFVWKKRHSLKKWTKIVP